MEFLKQKRNRSLSKLKEKMQGKDIIFERKTKISPNSKLYFFIDENGNEASFRIKSGRDLKKKIHELEFEIPYYIDREGRQIIINNIQKFFDSEINRIYKLNEISLINQTEFDEQYDSIPNKLAEEPLYLDKLFFNNKKMIPYHTSNYEYIFFKNFDLNFKDMRYICSSTEKTTNIIEIFRKKNVGITTFLYIFYSQLRTRVIKADRFIPFILFNYSKLLSFKEHKILIETLYFNILNLFVEYIYYKKFCTKIYNNIIDCGFNIPKIIITIITSYMEHIKEYDMGFVPCIIIDNFNPDFIQLQNDLIILQKNYNFKVIFVYKLENRSCNRIILDYFIGIKNESFLMKYTNTLYENIGKLPNKYPQYFNEFSPIIENYLKINNCESEENVKQMISFDEEEIEKEIYKFYKNEQEIVNLYLNEILVLIDKPININKEFIQNIFLNIPLNVLDIEITENNNIKIKYSSKNAKKVIYKICSSSIINLLPKLHELNIDNFIKGGIFKRGITELFKKEKPIFGKIDEVIEFDRIINSFRNKKNYKFTDEEINNKFKKMKSIKKLKTQYKNFEFNERIIITQNQNGKDWDIAIIEKDKNNNNLIRLCLVLISINKTINEIQIILENFFDKQKYIKKKIKEILNIEINETHILFVLMRKTQNTNTLFFLNEYKIPFIYYDIDTKSFIDEPIKYINSIKLDEKTLFNKNNLIWNESLKYNKNGKIQKNEEAQNNEEEEDEISEQEEEGNNINTNNNDKIDISNIIFNKNEPKFD